MTTEASSRSKNLTAAPLPPTKVIVITNQKGGVGKTTTTVNCAWLAVELDTRPALVIELCSQGNASSTLVGPDYENTESLKSYDLLTQDNPPGNPLKSADNIEVIPSSIYLFDIDNTHAESIAPIFAKNVRRIAESNRYSWIFIDTPPSLGALQLAGLYAADYAVIPVGLNKYSMDGLDKLLDSIVTVQEDHNPRLAILGILPNLVNAARKEQIDALRKIVASLGDMVLQVPLRDRAPIADAIDRGHAVWKNVKSGNARAAAAEMRAVISDILRRAR